MDNSKEHMLPCIIEYAYRPGLPHMHLHGYLHWYTHGPLSCLMVR